MVKPKKNQSGQGMTEYILIVALIAVAVIAAVKLFGSNVQSGFNNAAGQISSNTSGGGVAGTVNNATNAVNNTSNAVNSVAGN